MTMHMFHHEAPADQGHFRFWILRFRQKQNRVRSFSGVMLLANNTLLIGFHVYTGARVLNTLADHSECPVVFSVIAMLMGIVISLPRTFATCLVHVNVLRLV